MTPHPPMRAMPERKHFSYGTCSLYMLSFSVLEYDQTDKRDFNMCIAHITFTPVSVQYRQGAFLVPFMDMYIIYIKYVCVLYMYKIQKIRSRRKSQVGGVESWWCG